MNITGQVVGNGEQDFVLAPKAGEDRDAAQGQRADGKGRRGQGHGATQATDASDVNVAVGADAVHDAAGAEEQEGLGETVGHEMEHRCRPAQGAQRQHHQAQVGYGGVGQDAFQVGGDQGDGGRAQGGYQADAGDDHEGFGGGGEDGIGAGDQIDAGNDHGGGVNQGADGSGAFHGVGQPDVEGELGRLAHCAQEQQDGGGGDNAVAELAGGRRAKASLMLKLPTLTHRSRMPTSRPTSPMRVTTKAFLAASRGPGFSNQKPMSR